MSVPGGPMARPYPPWEDDVHTGHHWLRVAVAILVALLFVTVLLAVAVPLFGGSVPAWTAGDLTGRWVLAFIGLLFVVWVAFWILRLLLFGLWGPSYYRPFWRGYYRYHRHAGRWGYDPAAEVARERFARGEISSEQLDQILRELRRGFGPTPPP